MYTLIRTTQGFLVFAIVACLFIPPLFPFALLLGVAMIVLIASEGKSANRRVAGLPPFAASLERRFIDAENAGKDWVAVSVGDILTEIPGNTDTETTANCRQAMESAMLEGDRILADPEDDSHGFKIRFDLPRRPVLRERPPA